MATVETVRGAIDVDRLGPTLMHDHIFILHPEYMQNYGRGAWDEDERVADAIDKLRSLVGKGIRTIVDPTVLGLGRDVPRIQRVAAGVPELNIVVATGIYTFHDVPLVYHYRGPGLEVDPDGTDPMVTDFVRDLTEGIAETGVKAAFLKCAVQEAMSPGVERVCRAVARAHRETGAPITTHTNARARSGRAAIELYRAEGVDLTKVVIGHCTGTGDLDYLTEIADSGAILGMDRFGADPDTAGLDAQVHTIAALCERGYADRMVLSHDADCFNDLFGPDALAVSARLRPDCHYEFLSDTVLPALRAAGVRDTDISGMLVDTPRRYFTRA
ncbi:phosphotriesterase family protein [Nocardia transvalensis]|uniref:phosphotriesterase family protein n=1 Tax=Nocardia transvalensis TaxID=37333 RepID=UPI001894A1FE|nr:phosphotriesterase [Nocardia transvalensis]MBF6331447.1 phosphotriesterase [Nocardia transvalensis]